MSVDYSSGNAKMISLKNERVLSLRTPVPDDASALIEYLNIVGGESDNLLFGANDFHLTEEQERAFILSTNQDSDSLMLLGIVDGQIMSIAHIHGLGRPRIKHNCEFSLVVSKAFWHLGIGSAMMEELITFAKNHSHIKNIHLGVKADNENAIKLYEKCGFKKTGVHQDYFCINGQYYDEILMDLQIQ